jgi:excisionase family DNA binding protein
VSSARALFVGLEGPEVRVTARVAVQLVAPLGEWLRRRHAAGEPLDPDLLATVAAFEMASAVHTASGNGSPSTPEIGGAASECGNLPHDEAEMVHDRRMSTAAAARRLGCSPRRARQLAAAGALPAHRLGGCWLFDPVDVDRYAAERRKGA